MEKYRDFLQFLEPDMSMNILMYLDNPRDLVCIGSVSHSWRQIVIENGLCKKLCLRNFPEVSSFAQVIEVDYRKKPIGIGSHNPVEWESLDRDHRVYAFLARALTSFKRKDCISEAICASSTDRYPDESIQNTLVPNDSQRRASYWSSKGESDPAVPETLTYNLVSKLCYINEINIQPFQAFFQLGFPLYSAKAVQFRMGHLKSRAEMQSNYESASGREYADNFIWTYVSPEFSMAQENCLQCFKLPKPVLCIGGILQIVLWGRVQRQESDRLFYICVSRVQVIGRPLSPIFDVETLDVSGKFILKYYPKAEYSMPPARTFEDEPVY